MAVSAPDSPSQIPGFHDRLGERVIVPQQSGALLEYLHFCDALARAAFFEEALKDRVARLSNFRHSSYCRVRRVQHVVERGGQPALVSAHVAGRRLAEILEVAARAELKPSTAAVMSVARQLMASVALLHDFAPDGFHGALGPDRLVLAGEGRVAITEHVLGTVVVAAAEAWGGGRLWRDFGIAALPDPKSAQWGRRVDVVQVGLTTLAMLLGRPLAASDYPDALPQLLAQLEETAPDGSHGPLRSPLRGWLERALSLRGDSSFRTLLEAQKAFGQLLQDEAYSASSMAWEAFVGVCETAALRVPAVVVVPEAATRVEPLAQEPAAIQERVVVPDGSVSVPDVSASVRDAAPPATEIEFLIPQPASDAGAPLAVTIPEPPEAVARPGDVDPVARLREDPFGPWPVATPAGSAATLLDTFEPPAAPPTAAAALASVLDQERPTPPSWSIPIPDAAGARKPEARSETLFEAPKRLASVESAAPPPAPAPVRAWEEPKAPRATSVADWRTRDRGHDLSALVLEDEQPANREQETTDDESAAEDPALRRERRVRIALLIGLVLVAVAAALLAPLLWQMVYEGRWTMGTLSLESDPPGALISIDGQVRGHTPAELRVKSGEHLLELQVGGSAKSKTVKVEAHARLSEKMTFPEAGERGGLMISTYPEKGKIAIDGIPRGEAPLKITDLQPGTHTLLIETPSGSQEQDVVVQSGRVAQLAVATASWIKVTAPYELTVYDNGRLVGTTGSAPVKVAPGRRHLDFVNQSLGLKLRQYVDAPAGQVVTVALDLPTGMMNLYADQTAEVLVDGSVVGQTPLPSLQVPLGRHEVVFRNPKYNEVRYTVAVTLTAPVKLNITFKK